MTTPIALDMHVRNVLGKKVKQLRQQGLLPATVYGKGVAPISVQIEERTFQSIYRQAGRTALIEVQIIGQDSQQKLSAFIHGIQRHPVTRTILHADFRAVNLKEAMNAEVPIHIVGKSPLVERGDAMLNHVLSTIEIRALPAELPQHLTVDVSVLDEMDKTIHVRDLATSSTYQFVTPVDELVISLTPVRTTAEEEPETTSSAEPQLIRKDREESSAG